MPFDMLLISAAPVAAEASTPVPGMSANASAGVTSFPVSYFANVQAGTAFEMVNRLPGFSFDVGDSVRGMGGGGNVLVDGERPVSKTDDLESTLRRISAGQIERIDLIRGGAPGIDMQGRTVVANIIRAKGNRATGLLSVGGNAFRDRPLSTFIRFERSSESSGRTFDLGLFGMRLTDWEIGDGQRSRVFGDGSAPDLAEVRAVGGGYRGTVNIGYRMPFAGGKLQLASTYAGKHYRLDLDDEVLAGRILDERDVSDEQDIEVSVKWKRGLSGSMQLETLAVQRIGRDQFRSRIAVPNRVTLYDSESELRESILRAELSGQTGKADWRVGAEADYNRLDSLVHFAENDVAVALPGSDVIVDEKRTEVFGQVGYRVTPDFGFEIGLKIENSAIGAQRDVDLEKSLQFIKPRLSFNWALNDRSELSFRIEREASQLDFEDVVSSQAEESGGIFAGNADLDPAVTDVVELELEQKFPGQATATLTIARESIADVIDRAPFTDENSNVFDAPANIGNADRDRLGLKFSLPLDFMGLTDTTFRGDGTWMKSEVKDPTTGVMRRISGEAPAEVKLELIKSMPKLRASWGIKYEGPYEERFYRYDQVETFSIGAEWLLFAEYKPSDRISLTGEIGNVSDTDYVRTREEYDGTRSTGSLDYIDRRVLKPGPRLFFRVRRTL